MTPSSKAKKTLALTAVNASSVAPAVACDARLETFTVVASSTRTARAIQVRQTTPSDAIDRN
jgi:hypothetical protein